MITWTAIILTIKNIAGYIIAHWHWIVGSLAVLAVLMLFGWLMDSCREKPLGKSQGNIIVANVEANALQNQKANKTAETVNANFQVGEAKKEVEKVKETDSNKYSNNFDETVREWCKKNCSDSICKVFREKGVCR